MRLRILWLLCLAIFAVSIHADEVFDASGFSRNRNLFSQLPFEHIDPMTGNLLLTFTDLVLPGNAGFDLRIQRTYNSKIYRNYANGVSTPSEDTWAGIGWTFHMGRIPDPPFTDVPPPVEMPDGSRHAFYHHIDGSGRFITRDFWVYDKNVFKLSSPNGVVYTFGQRLTLGSGQIYRYATRIEDPFGNAIDIAYMNPTAGFPADGITSITQSVGGNTRTITFAATTDGLKRLTTMTYLGRTWTYSQVGTVDAGITLLTGVTPPVGPGWGFAYNTSTIPRYELTSLTTPQGGAISYTYGDQTFNLGSTVPVRSRVVRTRNTAGRDVPAGSWTYAYAQGADQNQSIITSPCNTTTSTFSGVGRLATAPERAAWKVGLPTRRVVSEGSSVLETEDLVWQSGATISNDQEIIGLNNDAHIFATLTQSRAVTRGGRTYTTNYGYASTNFNDYGRANSVNETGELSRTTARTFVYGFARYIVDRLQSETVTVGGESFSGSYAYNPANGFKTAETVYGLSKAFTPDAFGNVASVTDGNNHTRSFQYTWGQVSRIQTPTYNPLLTRVVNSDGTIQSETRRGFTTSFTYDELMRPRTVSPPLGNPTTIEYDNAGPMEFVRTTRGPSVSTAFVDGFGRPSHTSNNVGVETDVSYDACGRTVFESLPYSGGATGTTSAYDGLGRLRTRTNADSTSAGYVYTNGIDVTITNERGIQTLQDWSAFGDPGDARLTGLRDGENQTWAYAYNALGSLKLVDSPGGGPNRSFVYNAKNQLQSETHPENGTVSYTYDPAGNLQTRTDPTFGTTSFGYDGDDRVNTVDRPGTLHDITQGWDASNNRTSVGNGFVSSSFIYDGANRMTSRTDTIVGTMLGVAYAWDGNDNLSVLTYPSGLSVTYQYDAANRITDVRRTGTNTAFATAFSYHPSGQPLSFTSGDGRVHALAYTARHFVDTINTGRLSLDYSYDDVGNVTSIGDARPGFSQGFTYDGVDRLVTTGGPAGPWGAGNFAYDAMGNRLSKTVAGTTGYGYTSERLTTVTGVGADSFTYDANGNTRTANGASYTYAPTNLMETATVGGLVTAYHYDADDLRKHRTGFGNTKYWVHGLGNQIMSEFEEPCAGQLVGVRDHIYAGNRLVAELERTAVTTVGFTVPSSSVAESVASGKVAVNLVLTTEGGGLSPCPVSVSYRTVDGTAVSGRDYTGVAGTFSVPAGLASGTTGTIEIPIRTDTVDEDDETFTVSLENLSGATLGTAAHVVTIVDDDPPPTLALDAAASVAEGDAGTTPMTFTVRLSPASERTVTVAYATADRAVQDGATAGVDYNSTSGTLTFAPGETVKTVQVSVIGEIAWEADETFAFNLASPVNATLGMAQAIGTITDDDRVFIRIDDREAVEGQGSAAGFRVWLSKPRPDYPVTVDYTTVNGSAAAGQDFTATSGTLTFTQGRQYHSIAVPIKPDSVTEGAGETFTVVLSNAVNAFIGRGTAVGTIKDPPSPPAAAPMYRAYNLTANYHFFTTSLPEFCNAVRAGYRNESQPVPFDVRNASEGVPPTGSTAIYRLYNPDPSSGRHYYTASAGERDYLMNLAWVFEKVEGFIYPLDSTAPGSTELFKLYNATSGSHLYTINAAEKDYLLTTFPNVWQQHTSMGRAFPSNAGNAVCP